MRAVTCTRFNRLLLIVSILVISITVSSQKIYDRLPVGKYAVGFKIITLIDSSRVSKPEYNYLGEKTEGDRVKKITIHLWYPAVDEPAKRKLVYGDYCYNPLLASTNEVIDTVVKNRQLNAARASVERWFGPTAENDWQTLITTPMLARAEAAPAAEKFPLIIGELRALSTTITNEMLASNGFVVAMIKDENFSSFADAALEEIPDMRLAMQYLSRDPRIDVNQLGSFSFSGSGFVPVLFGMYDQRVKAVADIESGIYMDVLFQNFSVSNFYKPSNLKVPFLHIFTRDLNKQEKYISEFENKTNHSTRYKLIVNQPAMHHWDNAAEGYTSCMYLHNRGDKAANTMRCFEIESYYMLHFFSAALKQDAQSTAFLSAKPQLPNIEPSLWDISVLNAVKPAPTLEEFEYIIRKKGVREAMDIVRNTIGTDSATDLRIVYLLNGLGYVFFREKKYQEAIEIFKLNVQLHPDDANIFDSLAEGYEAAGDNEGMKKAAANVLQLLNKKETLNDGEKAIKEVNQKRVSK